MDLLAQGATLHVQIGPVPLRLDLAQTAPRPERPESTNTRPDASNTRPNVAAKNPRPNPTGRSETGLTRPDRHVSKCPPAMPVSPYTDWSSLSDNDVISVHSEAVMLTMCLGLQCMNLILQAQYRRQRTGYQQLVRGHRKSNNQVL